MSLSVSEFVNICLIFLTRPRDGLVTSSPRWWLLEEATQKGEESKN